MAIAERNTKAPSTVTLRVLRVYAREADRGEQKFLFLTKVFGENGVLKFLSKLVELGLLEYCRPALERYDRQA